MLRNVSRTFALSIEQLPCILRETVTIAYLLFRISDSLEDHESLKSDQKAELLRLWSMVLKGERSVNDFTNKFSHLDGTNPEVYVAKNARIIIDQLQKLPDELRAILVEHVNKTSLGMARWQEHVPYVNDEQEMDDYMHQVAGRVGYLLTEVFSWYSPSIRKSKSKLMPLGREFGLALQTVNIIRGIKKDFERGWVFIPAEFYKKVGLTRSDFFDPANISRALKVINMLADKADRHLQCGLEYITLLPKTQHRIRLFCMWPLLFAVRTLAISRNNSDVLLSEAKISRGQVKKIIGISQILGWSNLWLTSYCKYLSKR
jgi:farnesyl-diphosphate farnesyltransferase